jgi:hypothetical protein
VATGPGAFLMLGWLWETWGEVYWWLLVGGMIGVALYEIIHWLTNRPAKD